MTAPTKIQTLNVSVEQIESDLRHGRTVQQIAQDWQEPAANVLAVKRAMDARGEKFAAPPQPPAAGGAPVPSVAGAPPATSAPSTAPSASSATPTVDALVAASSRSTSKRTQALGKKLDDLALQIRGRLAAERKAAEAAERVKAEQEQARAEVERLEKQLRDAREKLRGGRGGSGSVQPKPKPASSLANLSGGRAAGEYPCSKCGRVCTTPAGRGSHERNCTGGTS